MRFLHPKWSFVLCLIVGSVIVSVGFKPNVAMAYTSQVEGSFANAMAFGTSFCNDTSKAGVGPSYAGFGDLVWITATDGSKNITFNQGTQYVTVQVHAAGKYCQLYNGTIPGSDYSSTDGRLSGTAYYSPNGPPNGIFNNVTTTSMYVGDLKSGMKRISMQLSSFFTMPNGQQAWKVPSPNAWTDLNITVNQQWNLSMKDAYIRQLNPGTGVPLPGVAGASHGTNVNVNGVPGERYGIYHWWVNNGSDPTNVTTYVRQVYTYPGAGQKVVDKYKTHAPGISGRGGWLWNGITGDTGVIPQSAIGQSYCMRTEAWPGSWNNAAPKVGSTMCVNVVRKFNLTPTVGVPMQNLAPGDVTMTPITPKVANSGPTDSYPNTYWQLIRFVIPVGGGSAPGASTGGTAAPCVYYTGAACGGQNSMVAQGNTTFGMPSTSLGPFSDTATGLVPGQQLCYALSVKGYDAAHNPATSSEYRYGTPVCIKVAKKPKVQIWGGDLRTRGNITTSVSKMGAALYGSWVEYGAFSSGPNTSNNYDFASGSGFAGGSNASTAERNLLTFANTTVAGTPAYGNYSVPTMLSSLAGQFTAATPVVAPSATSPAMSLALDTVATGTYKLTAANVNISGNVKGASIVLYSSGTVTITGDINYQTSSGGTTFSDPTQLPQLIIIANTINIAGNVQTVNAWLLATGKNNAINTCSDKLPTDQLSTKLCANPLTINGPVATDTLYLRRTAGSDTVATADSPAEVINLRADAYVWAYNHTTGAGRAQTDQVSEAAPRF